MIRSMIRGLGLLLVTACASQQSHIGDYEPKRREYKPVVEQTAETQKSTDGAIWAARSVGDTLFTDARAFRVNDIVTVRIEEMAKAQRGAQTQVDRDASFGLGADVMGTFEKQRGAGVDPERLLRGQMNSDFRHNGRSGRSENVQFTVAATVTQVLPNGNLFVEGTRVVLVNNEEHHFYISGVARPEDIDRQNAISSIRLADAEVEFVGDGDMSNGQRPGWLLKFLKSASPF